MGMPDLEDLRRSAVPPRVCGYDYDRSSGIVAIALGDKATGEVRSETRKVSIWHEPEVRAHIHALCKRWGVQMVVER